MAPIFDYKAINRQGSNTKGTVEAETAKSARIKLKKTGLMVTQIAEKTTAKSGGGSGFSIGGGKVKVQDIALMTRQLASLIKANIPLVEALTALVEQTDNEKLKVVLDEVKQDVNEGVGLSKAMSKHPRVFDNIYINMIDAGESSGTLGLVMLKLADLKEGQMRLKRKVTSAMTYPTLMLTVSLLIVIGLFGFVIPKMTKIFESMKKPMPAFTKFLLGISEFLTQHWFIIAVSIVIAFVLFRRYIKTEKGHEKWDRFKLTAPIIGTLVRMIEITRFTSTMATLLATGVPILTCMNISRNLVENLWIKRAIENARANVTEGQSIADPLKRSGEFPPLVIHMIAIGEKTGELPEMLENVASGYEEQVGAKIDGMTSLLEPAMIIFMGAIVVTVVIAVFVPLMDMSNIN